MPRYIKLAQVESTNTYLLKVARELPGGTVIHTPCQTAGRGQKGNRWLATPGMNATFSYLFKPTEIAAREQFVISEAASVAVAQVLGELTGRDIKVKWPNDIYHGDHKLCGMLIECSLAGRMVDYAVIGIGINVNQREFDPYAPNPTSLTLISGREVSPDEVMRQVCERMELLLRQEQGDRETWKQQLHEQYLAHLYRNDGRPHPFALPDGTLIQASIAGVELDGTLSLRHADGTVHHYAFKQVAHVIHQRTL
ncbi:MAG: biotin--[Muribaculaceae bacterium]|nr:biotin--[acetyl-CoA-carboxylase] ligase [Muribaculaceae bacterium]